MCPNPLVIKPEERISQLRPLLSDPHWKFQTANILKLIELYESGEAPPPTPSRYELWLRDGKIIEPPGPNEIPDIPTGSAIWIERVGMQMMQQAQPSSVPYQMAQSASYGFYGVTRTTG